MNKLQAIKQTIYNLENDVYEYNWTETDKCNCGVVARTLLDGELPNRAGFSDSPLIDEGLTCFASYASCIKTDLPLPLVFSKLKEAGFTHRELIELENLSNEIIVKKLGMSLMRSLNNGRYKVNKQREDKGALILYLKAWAEILEAEQPAIEPTPTEQPKERIVYVKVPVTISESVPETILN